MSENGNGIVTTVADETAPQINGQGHPVDTERFGISPTNFRLWVSTTIT